MGVIKPHIEITPGVCGGKPRIAGHRIRVQDIVIMHDRMGKDPYEIVNDYPSDYISRCLCRTMSIIRITWKKFAGTLQRQRN